MTPIEAAALCRFTKALCPQQAIDEYTPDAWHLALGDLRFEDAKTAVVTAAQKSPFVAPAEIRAEVRALRNGRLTSFGPLPNPPAELADDPEREIEWRRTITRRIADGQPVERPVEVEAPSPEHTARLAELTRGAFREVPAEDDALRPDPSSAEEATA